MMENSRWAKEIISLQKPDGSWGYFHTLSNPTKSQPITTEQALRRLKILGLTENDEPIQRALKYIESCPSARDGINFPLSDSWRSVQSRRNDCTLRIERLIKKLGY